MSTPEGLVKITVNLLPEAYTALLNSAQRDEDNRTTVINRAIQFYDLIVGQMIEQGVKDINIGNRTWRPSNVFPEEF